MPSPLTTYINLWREDYSYIRDDLANVAYYIQMAGSQAGAHNWEGVRDNLWLAATSVIATAGHFWAGADNLYDRMYAAMHWIDNNWPTTPTITMPAILNAMQKATFDELQSFIGIEDAYRVALWNAPFNADFYAALARGFVKWP